MKNVLFIGNGINLQLYNDVPLWNELLAEESEKIHTDIFRRENGLTAQNEDIKISNNTLQYESIVLKSGVSDNALKEKIVNKLTDSITADKMDCSFNGINSFADLLQQYKVTDIITTNFDTGIESILTEYNGFVERPQNTSSESVYSIRRKKEFALDDFTVNLWKIHGDINTIASISLGFDQYCGALSRVERYVKGKYEKCAGSMEDKLNDDMETDFDNISWIELFFNANVYIACIGMDLSEIDIWWILNKRRRYMNKGIDIKNKIVFLYNDYDVGEGDSKTQFDEKISLLDIFSVEHRRIGLDRNFIINIFDNINN